MVLKKSHCFLFASLLLICGCRRSIKRSVKKGLVLEDTGLEDVDLPVKGIDQTNLEEALLCKKYHRITKNLDLSVKYAEHALSLAKEHDLRKKLILEIADSYVELKKYDKARVFYSEFRILYPGSNEIPYVLYREVLTNSFTEFDEFRDSTPAENTIVLADNFLKEYPDSQYVKEVKYILKNSTLKVLRHKLNIARFYLKRYSFDKRMINLNAANSRIEDAFLKDFQVIEPYKEQISEILKKVDKSSLELFENSLKEAIEKIEDYLSDFESGKIENKASLGEIKTHLSDFDSNFGEVK